MWLNRKFIVSGRSGGQGPAHSVTAQAPLGIGGRDEGEVGHGDRASGSQSGLEPPSGLAQAAPAPHGAPDSLLGTRNPVQEPPAPTRKGASPSGARGCVCSPVCVGRGPVRGRRRARSGGMALAPPPGSRWPTQCGGEGGRPSWGGRTGAPAGPGGCSQQGPGQGEAQWEQQGPPPGPRAAAAGPGPPCCRGCGGSTAGRSCPARGVTESHS